MEYRKATPITPTVMYKEDLMALEALLRELLPSASANLQVRAEVGGQEYSAAPFASIGDMFGEAKLPKMFDQLTIELEELDENGALLRRIGIFLCKRISNFQLYSARDNEWLLKVNSELKAFFKQRRPWYWYFAQSIPPVLNLSVGLSMVMVALIIVSKVYVALLFPAVLVTSAVIYFALGFSKITFRHARLCLFSKPEDRRPNYEMVQLGAHATVLTISAVGIFSLTAGKI